MAVRITCRSCGQQRQHQRKGLCSRCYADPTIRACFGRLPHGSPLTPRSSCRGCGGSRRIKARGLCHACYVAARQAAGPEWCCLKGDFMGQGANPVPTTCRPGTPEKLAVLAERVRRREALFCPLDADFAAEESVSEHARHDARRRLEQLYDEVASAPLGCRCAVLRSAALELGGLVAQGLLSTTEVENRLTEAALRSGLGDNGHVGPEGIADIVRSALTTGQVLANLPTVVK